MQYITNQQSTNGDIIQNGSSIQTVIKIKKLYKRVNYDDDGDVDCHDDGNDDDDGGP